MNCSFDNAEIVKNKKKGCYEIYALEDNYVNYRLLNIHITINTDNKIHIPKNYVGLVVIDDNLANKNIELIGGCKLLFPNSNVKNLQLKIANRDLTSQTLNKGDKIANIILIKKKRI